MWTSLKRLAAGTALTLTLVFPAQADTLRQVMADAYRHSHLLEQNRYLLRIQDEGVAQAVAQLRPTLSFVASASRDLVDHTTTATASLVAEYLIYDGGGRRFGIEAAEETVLATREQLVTLEQQVLLDAVTAYIGVWENHADRRCTRTQCARDHPAIARGKGPF